jgi:hypothetical protein
MKMTWPIVAIIGVSAFLFLRYESRKRDRDLAKWIKDQENLQCEQAVEEVKDYLATTRPFE